MTIAPAGAFTASSPPAAAAAPVPGPILFARYAFGPNRLGYCGPDDAAELFGQATTGGELPALRRLAQQFEGAYPYLELIARANGIADPLDARVVEAYWLGNELVARVRPADLAVSLDFRFRRRLRGDGWRWLADKPGAGALPVHAFHVLDVFPRLGLLRGGVVDDVVKTIDSCRIRWGRVLERDGDWLVVAAVPMALVDGKLALLPPRAETVRGWQDGRGFLGDAQSGDVVSLHWDWACDLLDARRLGQLQRWTERELRIANLTI
ncbi:MAG: DUF6390 family protein [Chloroflexota bacterium]